jgi:hypothetical protein
LTELFGDIFDHKDFQELCTINGDLYVCVCSSISDEVAFVDTGAENPALFTLDLKLPLHKQVKINDKVKFRERLYKISSIDFDSANASLKLHLCELNKGIGK